VIVPPELFLLGTPPSVIRRRPPRARRSGTLRVIVVLVDFSDKHMAQTQQHFRDLFFAQGGAKKSVRDYYHEVTNGLIDIQGDVVGPFRLPQTLAAYAHGASGMKLAKPNAQTMARDAAIAANASVDFTPYDNDGNGFVDAFIVIHAGTGAETNSHPGDIWSHKWTLDGGAMVVDATTIFAYLTVPEDCKIGVCAHELGHLLFGFPDLYDTDNSSEGIGNWCLMASGSWGGNGDAPTHPCAWCKMNQGWVKVRNRTTNGKVSIADVKTSRAVYRLWRNGAAGKEYFLVENRQKSGSFDVSMPGSGLLIWHVDENQTNNRDENHYWVGLMQADGKRDLELSHNRGDAGDCWPGSAGNADFSATSTPGSTAYSGAATCVAVTGISKAGATMTAKLQVKCPAKQAGTAAKKAAGKKPRPAQRQERTGVALTTRACGTSPLQRSTTCRSSRTTPRSPARCATFCPCPDRPGFVALRFTSPRRIRSRARPTCSSATSARPSTCSRARTVRTPSCSPARCSCASRRAGCRRSSRSEGPQPAPVDAPVATAASSSGHDVHAAVDVQRLARHPPCVRRREKRAGVAHVHDVDQLADRGALRGLVEEQVEILQAGCSPGLERPGRNGVHPDVARAELVGEIARAGLERGLHRPHDVVVRHDLARAVIAHGEERPAILHQRRREARHAHVRMAGDVDRLREAFGRALEQPALEVFLRRPGDRMDQDVEAPPILLDAREYRLEIPAWRHRAA
jgi:immune inhibitor A